MTIGICDDDFQDADRLKEMVERYFHGEKVLVEWYPGGEELLERQGRPFDLLFLDVYMNGMDGIGVARTLRERGEKGQIVLTTSGREFGPESYEIGASWYLVKPFSYEEFSRAMNRCTEGRKGPELSVSIRGNEVSLPVRQIDFIETEGRQIVIHMGRQEIRIYDSLERLYAQLGEEDFIRPQRSYILNMAYIKCLEGENFCLMNGEKVSITRSNRKTIREIYHNYLFRMLEKMEGGTQ